MFFAYWNGFSYYEIKKFVVLKYINKIYQLALEPSAAKVTNRLLALERFYRETTFSLLKSTLSI